MCLELIRKISLVVVNNICFNAQAMRDIKLQHTCLSSILLSRMPPKKEL